MTPSLPNLPPSLLDAAPALHLYARSLGLSADAARDAVQESLVRLIAQRETPRDPRAWVFRTVRNLVASSQRREGVAHRSMKSVWAKAKGDGEPVIDADRLSHALQSLPDESRELVILKAWGGLTFEQIGAITGISAATAHRRFQESLAQLRLILEPPCPSTSHTMKITH